MNDVVISLIRTYTPILAGSLLSWLALDEATSTSAVTALTGIFIALYYTVVRLLERKFPRFGILLGSTREPEYAESK